MMIRAIAIYQLDGTNPTQPYIPTKHYVPADAYKPYTLSTLTFWQVPDYLLINMEKNSLPAVNRAELESLRAIHFPYSHEHHYFKKVTGQPFIMVIVSKSRISDSEACYLFKNIQNALLYPDASGVTLTKIIQNPLDYIAKDHLPEKLKTDLAELKQILLTDIDKMLERGERLDDLQTVTLELCDSSARFKRESKKQTAYCSYC